MLVSHVDVWKRRISWCFIIFACYYQLNGSPMIYPKESVVINCLSADFLMPKSGQSSQNHPVLEPISSILPSMVVIKACTNGDKTINSVVRNICIKCLYMYNNRKIFVGIYWFMFLQVIVKVNKEDTQYVTMLLCYYVTMLWNLTDTQWRIQGFLDAGILVWVPRISLQTKENPPPPQRKRYKKH